LSRKESARQLIKQTAADLDIVEKTIKVHRVRVMEKMGASSLSFRTALRPAH
jgi:FixJ family two-component response regulator